MRFCTYILLLTAYLPVPLDKQTKGGLTEGMKYHQNFWVTVSLETGGSCHPPTRKHRPADLLSSWSMLRGRMEAQRPWQGQAPLAVLIQRPDELPVP